MRLISCPPSFLFGSSNRKMKKKKNRDDSAPSLASRTSSEDQITTPKSVLSPKLRRRRLEEQSSSSSLDTAMGCEARVTRRELEAVLRRLHPKPLTEAEVEDMLAEADRRGALDGGFSVEGIAALGLSGGPASPELRETFAVFDGDGDGKISAEELCGLFAALGDGRCSLGSCQQMIGIVDTDGDGFVCFDDFARMMQGGM